MVIGKSEGKITLRKGKGDEDDGTEGEETR